VNNGGSGTYEQVRNRERVEKCVLWTTYILCLYVFACVNGSADRMLRNYSCDM